MGRHRKYESRKEFFKQYIKNSIKICCDICGVEFKKCYKSIHNKSNHHNLLLNFKNQFILI
jgi:hypothetical protein